MIYGIAWEYRYTMRRPFSSTDKDAAVQEVYSARKRFIDALYDMMNGTPMPYSPSCHFVNETTDDNSVVTVIAREFFTKGGRFREKDMEKVKDRIKSVAGSVFGDAIEFISFIDEERLDGFSLFDTMDLHSNTLEFMARYHTSEITSICDFTSDINPFRTNTKWHYYRAKTAYALTITEEDVKDAVKDGMDITFKIDELNDIDKDRFFLARLKVEETTDIIRHYLNATGEFLVRRGGASIAKVDGSDSSVLIQSEYFIGIRKTDMDKRKTNAERIISMALESAGERIEKDLAMVLSSYEVADFGGVPSSPKAFVKMCTDDSMKLGKTLIFANDLLNNDSLYEGSQFMTAITFSLTGDLSLPDNWQNQELSAYVSDYAGRLSERIDNIIAHPKTYGVSENVEDIIIEMPLASFTKDKDSRRIEEAGVLCLFPGTIPPYIDNGPDAEALVMPVFKKAVEMMKSDNRLTLKNIRYIANPIEPSSVTDVYNDIIS